MIQCVSTHVAWKCFELACQISLKEKEMKKMCKNMQPVCDLEWDGQCTKPEKCGIGNLSRKLLKFEDDEEDEED